MLLISCTFLYYSFPNKVAVLGYHSIINTLDNKNDMELSVKKFEKQMAYLKKYNYKTLNLNEMDCYMNKKCKIKKNTVLITFDDGYLNNLEYALPILKKYNFNAVIFVIGKYVMNKDSGFLTEHDIIKIKNNYPNIEIASHSYDLHYYEAKQLRYEDYINDFDKQNNWLNTKYYAYPYGYYNNDIIKALKEKKYKLAFGFGPDNKFRKADNNDNKLVIPRLCISANMPMWKFKLRLLMPF